jgi:3-oxoacyl-[acyl-carrier-protein] synthase II
MPGLVINQAVQAPRLEAILNNSFGMLGINSALIVKKYGVA